MLVVVRGNGERLLHQAVRLVAVTVRPAVGVLLVAGLSGFSAGVLVEAAASPLALHLAVGEKAARNTAGTPGFAICPSAHAGFALIPDENRSRFDRLPFLLRKAPLDTRKETDAACFKENDGVRRSADVPVICLHCYRAV